MAALAGLLRGSDDELRAAAAKALGAIAPEEGIGEVVQAQGYLARWMVIGTFLNDEKNTAFNQAFPPEQGIDFEAKYLAKYVWVVEGHRKAEDKPIERESPLDIDGDDGFRVWLNGEQIAEQVAEFKARQPCVARQNGIKLRLKAGTNRFFVKTANIDHQWWLRLRLTDSTGSPIDFDAL